MKTQTTRKLRSTVMGGLVTLMSGLGLTGTGCIAGSEFSKMYKPNEISSTHKQRDLFEVGRKIEKLMEGGKPYTFEDSTNSLYVRADNFYETLEEFGLKNTGTYNEIFETNRLKIEYEDQKTGGKVVTDQIVPNDGTVDVKGLGSFGAFGTRQSLDDKITAAARKKFGDDNMEVLVTQMYYPNAVAPSVFLGYATVTTPHAVAIVDLTRQPLTLEAVSTVISLADSKYMVGIKRIQNIDSQDADGNFFDSNGDGKIITSTHDPNYIGRVVVMGEPAKFAGKVYGEIKVGDKDVIAGLGNRPVDNVLDSAAKIAEPLEALGRITGGAISVYSDIDAIGHEWSYLPSRGANRPNKPHQVERFTKNINMVNEAVDSVNTLSGKFGSQQNSGASSPAPEGE